MVANMIRLTFDYVFVPALGTCGGILVAWRSDRWLGSNIWRSLHTLTIRFSASLSALVVHDGLQPIPGV
jgi:hypothetical protein